MFLITPTIESDYPNAFAKAEREKPKVTRKSLNEWRVGNYLVRFTKFGRRIFADCVNVVSGEVCKSTLGKDRLCYHVGSVLIRVRREESRKAA